MTYSSDNKPDKTVSNKLGILAKQIIFCHNSRLHGPCSISGMKSPLSRKHALRGPCPFESGHYCVHASFTQSLPLMTHPSQSNELYSPVTSHPLFTTQRPSGGLFSRAHSSFGWWLDLMMQPSLPNLRVDKGRPLVNPV